MLRRVLFGLLGLAPRQSGRQPIGQPDVSGATGAAAVRLQGANARGLAVQRAGARRSLGVLD